MFNCLHIENIAIMDNVDIEFREGLNVLTGETGAGKSILIDSVNLLTGERSSKDLVRTGSEKAQVEGIIWTGDKKVLSLLEESGIDYDENDPIVLMREISKDGRSIVRINGRVSTTGLLKSVCSRLINIHGQHDNQSILNPASHQKFLDSFASNQKELSAYSEIYAKVKEIEEQLMSVDESVQLKEQKKEILTYQIDEIKNANLYETEEEDLVAQRTRFLNSEAILTSANECYSSLYGTEDASGAIDLLDNAISSLKGLMKFDARAEKTYSDLENLRYEIEDAAEFVRDLKDSCELEEIDINEVEGRLDLISRLKRKYGDSVPEILETLKRLEQEYFDIENASYTTEQLEKELKQKKAELKCAADALSKTRKAASEKLEKAIMNELSDLEMARTRFSVQFTPCDFFSGGGEKIEFLIAPNSGEDLKPLTKIASGGELSRIILALKVILSEADKVETLIFDEVDSGVSGKAAQKIGEKLKKISKNKQVFVITHLAQVAAFADTHFKIQKSEKNNKTYSEVLVLDEKGRTEELARFMSGAEITESSLNAAKELLLASQK
ncbi:MAG: DNA repair protein RecN [Clostridia bacterium]|nr:DNA repair protein RecN [Clostridia bacterium]